MDWSAWEGKAFWAVFTLSFLAVAAWESRAERLRLRLPTGRRWGVHAFLLLAGAVARMVVLRTTPMAVALAANARDGWRLADLTAWVSIPVTMLVLDLTRYLVHRAYHAVPWLWRIHRVHHSDEDFDVSTGSRFHPLEALLGQAVELGVILLMAPPAAGVLVALVAATIVNHWEHANADLPPVWERVLGRWLITPAMHRTHHRVEMACQQSNYGELVPWWDRAFGTFLAPVAGDADKKLAAAGQVVGIEGYEGPRTIAIGELLLQPLRTDAEMAGEAIAHPANS